MIKTKVETTRLLTTLTIIMSFLVCGHDCKVVQFIFGDSLSDVGNNNYLAKSLARASLPWYGIDFGNGLPNGRFSNGRTVADIIGDNMGLPRPRAFHTSFLGKEFRLNSSSVSLNFNQIGYRFCPNCLILVLTSVQRFGLYKQIELFQGTQELIRGKIGESEAEKFFQEARYVVALGSNDFINNYLMPVYTDSWTYSDNTFVQYLMETLRNQLTILHGLGARKLMVFGLGPMGCIPLQRVLSSSGFSNADSPCCSFGKIRPALTCIPASTLCKDRSKYVFWDEYHPSDRANELIASEMIKKLGFKPVNQTDSPPPAMAPSAS
ncbi:UNVERIFIED_CONTAM: GDSL esterase/lipase [Sesamum radiatum]|uniref:GDSL esterase/lipase n=1 Tax=Sesamum radiatum TaxID=300843 RepID=A0AAW2MWW6_SESRA